MRNRTTLGFLAVFCAAAAVSLACSADDGAAPPALRGGSGGKAGTGGSGGKSAGNGGSGGSAGGASGSGNAGSGNSGTGGAAGTDQSGGASGSGGVGGSSGSNGVGGSSGSNGVGGSSGSGGSGGSGGNGGTAGAAAGSGGSAGSAAGTGGSGGGTPSWNASPPSGVSPAPSGPVVGRAGEFDTGTLATNEVWDNFDGASGSNPDSRLWLEDTINQGGTQVYDPSHSFLDGSGNAVLEATKSGGTITSGRFTSRTKFNMQYGWCAARIKFPKAGRSWFPAWWMLLVGYNYNPYGEIDMMEFFGNTTEYSTHIHFGDGIPSIESNKAVPSSHSGGNAGDGFHTYWMQWEPDRIRIGVDDLQTGDWTPASVPAGAWDHMRQPFYFIANFAVAPSWLPAPLDTDFPARMIIDWVWYKPL